MTILNRVAAARPGSSGRPSRLLTIELLVLVLFALMPLVLALIWGEDDSFFWVVFTTKVMLLSFLALSFDLAWGYAGLMSFGQALFFGGSGYVVAVMSRDLGISSVFIIVPVGTVVGLILAALLGAFLLSGSRTPSIIFIAFGTLTGSYAAERLARAWYYLGGQNGVSVSKAMTIGDMPLYEGFGFYYLAFGFLLVVYIGCRFLVRSQFGLVLAGIREREERIAFLGYKVQLTRALVFALSGAIAGLGGGLYAFHEGFVWPALMGPLTSTQAILYALFGGVSTLIGPIVGVAGIEFATIILIDYLRDYWIIILGFLLLLVIMFRPTGLVGLLVSDRERIGSFGRHGVVSKPDARGD